MHFTIKHLLFKQFIKQMSSVTDEVKIRCDANGVASTAIDWTNVSMFTVNLPKSTFENYQCNESELFAVNLNEITPFLGLTYGYVTLDTSKALSVTITSGKYSISVKKLEPKDLKPEPNQPQVNFTSGIILKASDFKKFIHNAKKIGNKLRIITNNNSATLEVEGDNSSVVSYNIDTGIYGLDNSLYSIDYLERIAETLTGEISIMFATNHPLYLTTNIGDTGVYNLLLAPRIEA